eukprot:CAMPEP_0194267174 /NCGR_PEP_ID=MMETSP0169-20130528/1793_1 /TAXON_ID=218684 /ORGANISM="Corethron pennatum, Strain L29A3" /LENGTH=358 /DNA_ID=CAMNT_0039007985 /DNA_START=195 /DNA_END=1271 /DNA_ORIENTATION=+
MAASRIMSLLFVAALLASSPSVYAKKDEEVEATAFPSSSPVLSFAPPIMTTTSDPSIPFLITPATPEPTDFPTKSPIIADPLVNDMVLGKFYIRFSLNLGPGIDAECIIGNGRGCIGVLESAKRAVAEVLYKETSSELVLSDPDPAAAPTRRRLDTYVAGSMAVVNFENEYNVKFLTFSLLVDVLEMPEGTLNFSADNAMAAVDGSAKDGSLIIAFTEAMKAYNRMNGIKYHERFKEAQSASVNMENIFTQLEPPPVRKKKFPGQVDIQGDVGLTLNNVQAPVEPLHALRIIGIVMFATTLGFVVLIFGMAGDRKRERDRAAGEEPIKQFNLNKANTGVDDLLERGKHQSSVEKGNFM